MLKCFVEIQFCKGRSICRRFVRGPIEWCKMFFLVDLTRLCPGELILIHFMREIHMRTAMFHHNWIPFITRRSHCAHSRCGPPCELNIWGSESLDKLFNEIIGWRSFVVYQVIGTFSVWQFPSAIASPCALSLLSETFHPGSQKERKAETKEAERHNNKKASAISHGLLSSTHFLTAEY